MVVRLAIAWSVVACAAGATACSSKSGNNPPGGGPDGPLAIDAPLSTGAYCPTGSNTTSAGSATVTFDVDVGLGPTQQQFGGGSAITQPAPIAVSEFVYGINDYPENNYLLAYAKTKFGMIRYGGDSYTAWNWMTNAENNGNDNNFTNTDQFLPYAYGSVPSDPTYKGNPHDANPAGAIVDGADGIPAAQKLGMATLVTVSVSDYVAANASDNKAANAPSADFVSNKPAQAAGGAQVYQDAFVKMITSTYTDAPVFFSLDNEPNYWKSTHPEVFGTQDLAFDDLVTRDAEFATAVRAAAPNAKIFGPVAAGLDGFTSLDDYGNLASTNPYVKNGTDAIAYYLAAMKTMETGGARLLDVLDLHYYNDAEGKAGTPKPDADCVQGPRDFWDPTYSTPDTSYDDYIQGWKPRTLIPRIQSEIDASYPGTRLSFSEYNNGCEGDIGGGVAEADTLGVFGQYGVFAATAWPLASAAPGKNWLVASYAAYRNYDGNGATVGNLALNSVTSDPVNTSVYAFAHHGGTGLEVVAINKTGAPITAVVRLSNACAVATATPSQLTSAMAAVVSAGAAVTITGNALTYTMPAMSVTTLELR